MLVVRGCWICYFIILIVALWLVESIYVDVLWDSFNMQWSTDTWRARRRRRNKKHKNYTWSLGWQACWTEHITHPFQLFRMFHFQFLQTPFQYSFSCLGAETDQRPDEVQVKQYPVQFQVVWEVWEWLSLLMGKDELICEVWCGRWSETVRVPQFTALNKSCRVTSDDKPPSWIRRAFLEESVNKCQQGTGISCWCCLALQSFSSIVIRGLWILSFVSTWLLLVFDPQIDLKVPFQMNNLMSLDQWHGTFWSTYWYVPFLATF